MKKQPLVLAVGMGLASFACAQDVPGSDEMWRVIQSQQKEIANLQAQLSVTADAVEAGVAGGESRTMLGGYGEHHLNLNRSSGANKDNMVDAHRYVLFVAHQFSDDLKFFSEFELEHGLAGEGKPGEVELEQAYIDWNYRGEQSVKLGQFLIPVGLINETHEPETFYGVERNNVEKNIIPATWWETGVAFSGELAPGLRYDAAIHSGLKLSAEGGQGA
jgi:hypothetical protein